MLLKKSLIGSNIGLGTLLVKISGKYKSELFLTFNDKRVNLHFIFDIMGAMIKGGLAVSPFLFTIIVLFTEMEILRNDT